MLDMLLDAEIMDYIPEWLTEPCEQGRRGSGGRQGLPKLVSAAPTTGRWPRSASEPYHRINMQRSSRTPSCTRRWSQNSATVRIFR